MRLGIVQMACRLGDREANLQRALRLLEELRGRADLAVLPELFTTGYHLELLGEDAFRRLAEPLPGETTDRLAVFCRQQGMAVLGNLVERAPDGALYDTCFLLDEKGRLAGTYRKVHIHPREARFFQAGSEFPVFSACGTGVGCGICFDHAFGEMFRLLALAGARVIAIPSAIPAGCEHLLEVRTRARAQDNQVYVGACNRAGREGEVEYAGHSMVVDPAGQVLCRADREETLLVATLELERIDEEREREPVLRCRRPDLYAREGGRGEAGGVPPPARR